MLWTGVFAAFVLGTYLLMWRAWKKRGRRQAGLPAPADAPADLGTPLLPTLTGRYFGSTSAGNWLDRIVAHGLGTRSAVEATLTEKGLRVDRPAAAGFFIPAADLAGARFEKAAAGKVLPEGGLLVVTWTLGDTRIDTGLRSDHVADHDAWVDAVTRLAAGDAPALTGTKTGTNSITSTNQEGTQQ
ncbi:hypothetical protein LZ495_17990 [Yinghuangia sp. KLBMP8922]|uniref:PH domain-containing protein n=1 Tax=Yinghuangia soli TaxID=2908204 RepID=A0AA41Q0K0_9ACTN|nr:hypothetical protein [Yinghuangia soli]MCF2529091.1 hypothetical protein [Yinghuangia soli]